MLLVAGAGVTTMVIVVGLLAGDPLLFSDRLALRAMSARVTSRQQAPGLHAMVEQLCGQADLPKPRVAIADSSVPNAFAVGRSPRTGRSARPRARPSALMIPLVTELRSPSGLPIASTISPTFSALESASDAGDSDAPRARMTARSSDVKTPTKLAVYRRPRESVTCSGPPPGHHVRVGDNVTALVEHHARPQPFGG